MGIKGIEKEKGEEKGGGIYCKKVFRKCLIRKDVGFKKSLGYPKRTEESNRMILSKLLNLNTRTLIYVRDTPNLRYKICLEVM